MSSEESPPSFRLYQRVHYNLDRINPLPDPNGIITSQKFSYRNWNERLDTIRRINHRMGHPLVPLASWALIQVADLALLKGKEAFTEDEIAAGRDIVRAWNQRKESGHLGLFRDTTAVQKTKIRDNHLCNLTGQTNPVACQIVPEWLLGDSGYKKREKLFCDLSSFFPSKVVERWWWCVDHLDPDGTDNMISMSPDCSTAFKNGQFLLWPARKSIDDRQLDLIFEWTSATHIEFENTPVDPYVSLEKLCDLGLSRDCSMPDLTDSMLSLDDFGARKEHFHTGIYNTKGQKLFTGHHFIIQTNDPVERPLPNMELMELAYYLNRAVHLTAGADEHNGGGHEAEHVDDGREDASTTAPGTVLDPLVDKPTKTDKKKHTGREIKMMYDDNDVSPEEKMAANPRYRYTRKEHTELVMSETSGQAELTGAVAGVVEML